MTNLTIRCKDEVSKKNTLRLFNMVKTMLGKNSEETLQFLCKAYLSNPNEVTLIAENYNSIRYIIDKSQLSE